MRKKVTSESENERSGRQEQKIKKEVRGNMAKGARVKVKDEAEDIEEIDEEEEYEYEDEDEDEDIFDIVEEDEGLCSGILDSCPLTNIKDNVMDFCPLIGLRNKVKDLLRNFLG
jgi:hypothetical protein